MATHRQPSAPALHASAPRWLANALAAWVAAGALAFALPAAAQQQDRNAEKAARRLQQQMRGLQQQVEETQAAKAKAEADKAALDKQLQEQTQAAGKLNTSLRRASDSLRASEKARADLAAQMAAQVAALEKQLAEQKRASDEALAAKDAELAKTVKTRDAQQAQLQGRYDEQVKLVGECSAKNDRLVKLSAELVDRYRNKSVSDVLNQRDPLFGIGDVQMFNLVQEYRDKADAERFSPSLAAPINR